MDELTHRVHQLEAERARPTRDGRTAPDTGDSVEELLLQVIHLIATAAGVRQVPLRTRRTRAGITVWEHQ